MLSARIYIKCAACAGVSQDGAEKAQTPGPRFPAPSPQRLEVLVEGWTVCVGGLGAEDGGMEDVVAGGGGSSIGRAKDGAGVGRGELIPERREFGGEGLGLGLRPCLMSTWRVGFCDASVEGVSLMWAMSSGQQA